MMDLTLLKWKGLLEEQVVGNGDDEMFSFEQVFIYVFF